MVSCRATTGLVCIWSQLVTNFYHTRPPAKELSKTDYTRVAESGNNMTWLGYVGNGDAPFFYPAVFNRVR